MAIGTCCDLCGRPSGDDAPVCTTCAHRATDALRAVHGTPQLHGLDVDLDISTARASQWGLGQPGTNPKGSTPPLLIDLGAAEAASVLRNTLTGWVRVVHDGVGGQLPPDNLAAMARWLAPLIGWARHADYGPEMVDEICAAVHQARRAVDRPGPSAYLGQCPTCDQPIYGDGTRATGRCRTEECEGAVDVASWRAWMWETKGDTEAGATRLSALLKRLGITVSASTIRMWASRGKLAASSHDGTGSPRYRLGDVLDLAAKAGKTTKASCA